MKNLYYTLSLVCLLLVFGCKKDKADAKTQIVGKWKIENITLKYYVDDKEIASEGEIETGSENDYIEFTSDGKVNTFSENRLSSTTYSIEESTKTLTVDDQMYTIIELTKSKLAFKGTETETSNGKNYRSETTINLKK